MFHENQIWIKQNNQEAFDVPQGCFDGAETSKIIGLYMMDILSKEYDKASYGIYRDDYLMAQKGSVPKIERSKKNIIATKSVSGSLTLPYRNIIFKN